MNFDGNTDYVVVPDNDDSLDMTSQMTIAAWIKVNDTINFYSIVSKQPSGTAGNNYPGNYEFRQQAGGTFRLIHQTTGGSTYTSYTSTSAGTAGVWQHVAVTLKEGDSVNFYINGVSTGESSQTAVFGIVNDEPVRIGIRKDGIYDFNGALDDIRIYNRALSGTEIQQIYDEGFLQAYNPVPADDESCVDPNMILIWQPGPEALSHDIYFGTDYSEVNNADVNDANVFMGNQDVNGWDPCGLDLETVYYWRIDELNDSNIYKGDIWSFTTSPHPEATDPSPIDEANNIYPIDVMLSWAGSDCVVSYDVYFGTDYDEVNDADINDTNVYMANQSTFGWNTGILDINTTYYWRIDAENSNNKITKGDIWNFTTDPNPLPTKASNPISDINDLHAHLTWTAGVFAESHDVYFGTTNPPPFVGNQTEPIFDPPEILDVNTVYYWRIDEKNGFGTTTGTVWSFNTDCLIGGNAGPGEYAKWVEYGKPDCWCCRKQCRGDADCKNTALKPVMGPDLTVFKGCYNKTKAVMKTIVINGVPAICADFDHRDTVLRPVMSPDLTIFNNYYNDPDATVPQCDAAPIITGPVNFWTN